MSLAPGWARGAVAASLALALAGPVLALGPASATPASNRPPRSAASARVVLPEREGAGTGRLDPALAELSDAASRSGARDLRALGKRGGVAVTGGRASVLVRVAPGQAPAAEKAVASAGGTVTGRAADGSLRVSVAVASLRDLAASEGVLRVTRTQRPRAQAIVSEGVRITNADRWHSEVTTAAGVKVGIIDIGFAGYEALEAQGQLPPASKVVTAVVDSGNVIGGPLSPFDPDFPNDKFQTDSHGSAVAEIVHETAPGAELYLVAIGDSVDVAAAVEWLNGNGVRVVNMSLGFIGSPLDGGRTAGADNAVNAAVSKAVNQYRMFWAGAAGNFRLNHWKGDYLDTDGDFALNWDARTANLNEFYYTQEDYKQGTPIEGLLWWRDSWTAAVNDYDLVLFRWDPTLNRGQGGYVSVNLGGDGEDVQSRQTGQQPAEEIYVDAATRDAFGDAVVRPDTWYAWAVVNMRPWAASGLPANVAGVDFDFFCPNQDLEIYRAERSIMTPADNESLGFMATGAISSRWDRTLGRPGFAVQEPYSSEGPNQRGVVTPEIAAPDDVSNFVMHSNVADTFAGTSASAPHLAGVAALVYGASPAASNVEVELYLRSNAIGLGRPGVDPQTGYGALNLPRARTVDLARLEGPTRYQTAIAISKTWPDGSAPTVVLASGAEFPDALAGSSLAGAFGAPVLLTPPSAATAELIAELKRLTAGAAAPTVQILGSERAVSRNVATQLAANGFTVVRQQGPTRYETAASIAAASLSLRASDTAFIVNGSAFPDALSAAPIAYKRGIPVLPVYNTSVPSAVASVIQQRGIKKCIIVGSTSVVGAAVESRLAQLTGSAPERWAGPGRYDTMKAVVDGAAARGWVDFGHVGIASGVNFPDALAGAAEAGRLGGPVLLSTPGVLADQPAAVLRDHAAGVSAVRLYGSEAALEGSVLLGARWTSDH